MNERGLSRRDALKFGAGLVVGFGFDRGSQVINRNVFSAKSISLPEKSTPAFENREKKLITSFEKEDAAELAIYLSQAAERIKPHQPKIINIDDVKAFEKEYVPHLASDNLVSEKNLKFPPIVAENYQTTEGTLANFHVLGESACRSENRDITLNERFFDKYSNWNSKKDAGLIVSTVAHELAHSNQVSCDFGYDAETITQMVSMNTLGSMTLEGSGIAFPGFLNQMSEFSEGYVLYKSIEDQKGAMKNSDAPAVFGNPEKFDKSYGLGWYNEFLGKLPNGEMRRARWAKSLDYWTNTDPAKLMYIIEHYQSTPYMYTVGAMKEPSHETRELNLPTPDKKLNMFSTYYILTHLPQITEGYIKNAR